MRILDHMASNGAPDHIRLDRGDATPVDGVWLRPPGRRRRQDDVVAEPIAEAEAYIQFRLSELASRNEHHRFEEIATRIARKRISSNILIATGPVSSGGDQQRDAETYMTRIPDELPHSAGFSASASTSPVVVACTVQQEKLKSKILDDLAGICAEGTDPVDHVAFFSVHAISEGITHDLKKTARDTYGVTLDIFCGADIATFLAEPDLVWVARHYLDLPSSLVPPPEGEPAPEWYGKLLERLRQNNGPPALTPATQGEVTQGLRFATWDADANADLPEWLDFMGAFLADSDGNGDSELAFRACYEMAVARFRGMGVATGVEDLVRRAMKFACTNDHTNVVDDAATLASYWGAMWSSGVGRTEAAEITEAVAQLRMHVEGLIDETDSSTHPVRAASLTGTLAFLHLVPDWRQAERERGRPEQVDVAEYVGVKLDEFDVDMSSLAGRGLVNVDAAMKNLVVLVDLLPHARAYSASQLARVFNLFAPVLSDHPSYVDVRDELDAATSKTQGQAATAERCRKRGMAFVKAGKPLEALLELHNAKVNWFNGDTLYGALLTMRYIGKLFADLKLMYAAKMYACAAAAVAAVHSDSEVKVHLPKALLEAAGYSQHAGCWADAAGLTEVALMARARYLTDPFDFEQHPDLEDHQMNAALELAAVRKFWPTLEPLIAEAHSRTGWFDQLAAMAGSGADFKLTEVEYQQAAFEQFAGPVFGDVGATRIVDFEALGVRWVFNYSNDRATVLAAEGIVAALQVFLADIAPRHPVLMASTVRVTVEVEADADGETNEVDIDDSEPELIARVVLSPEHLDGDARQRGLFATCFQLLHAVHARPAADLEALMEPMFKAGLPHKIVIGRPYEEAAGILDDRHYARCAAGIRPASSAGFRPAASPSLVESTRIGAGYDRSEAIQAIRERYEVVNETLRYTLPRLLADESRLAAVVRLREAGWLDWQILVALGNAAWNWRMLQAGIGPGVGDRAEAMRLAREPETADSPEIPLEVFSDDALSTHILIQAHAVAQRWKLQGRQEKAGEEAMRDLLTRRYRYGEDDVPHTDLLDCIDEDGRLRDFLGTDAGGE
ncbi:hypothetical protein [Dactylosporangium sp. NPDC006015]|uniref:hypothetical protein n=1 Tax=Dactylosporangium sp. NPDC006015 TaxID=3154576 RepID=UPI0033A3AF20